MSLTTSPTLTELAGAFAGAQAEFGAIPKDKENPFFKSKYADLASVVTHTAPVLGKHGLAVTQFPGVDPNGDTLTTVVMHKSGEWIADTMRLHLSKADPQGHGSALTYARRYAYMSALGLVADEDDDGNAATKAAKAPKPGPPFGPALTEADRKSRYAEALKELTNLDSAALKALTARIKEKAGGYLPEIVEVVLTEVALSREPVPFDETPPVPEPDPPEVQ